MFNVKKRSVVNRKKNKITPNDLHPCTCEAKNKRKVIFTQGTIQITFS